MYGWPESTKEEQLQRHQMPLTGQRAPLRVRGRVVIVSQPQRRLSAA